MNRGDQRWPLGAFAALGLAQAVVYATLALWSGYAHRPTLAMSLVLIAFIFYLAAVVVARPLAGHVAFSIAIVLGLLFRAWLLPKLPFFSDDHFRYLWDGVVQIRGINPFRHAPIDPALAGIDDALRSQVNHPSVPTIYPPLAQVAFLLVALAPGGIFALKALWLACDVGIAALLFKLVPAERRLQAWTIYWWSPLVVIEVAWNAHLDLMGVLPLVLALWLARRPQRPAWGIGLALAGAALVKYFAAALLPAALQRTRRSWTLVAFVLAIVVLYLPYVGAGPQLFAGLSTYAELWRFNDALFAVLTWLVRSPMVAKGIAAAIILGLVVGSVRNEWTLERTAFWVTGAILILSPTVHPWYLLWMVPLVAIRPSRAWLYLTGSVFLAYYGLGAYRSDGVWPEPLWIKLAIYAPFFVLLIYDGWRGSWWQTAWRVFTQRAGGDGGEAALENKQERY